MVFVDIQVKSCQISLKIYFSNGVFNARRDALVEALNRHLGGVVCLGDHDCGMHMVVTLNEGLNEEEVVSCGRRLGMAILPLTAEYFALPEQQGFLIGFSNVQVEEIDGIIG